MGVEGENLLEEKTEGLIMNNASFSAVNTGDLACRPQQSSELFTERVIDLLVDHSIALSHKYVLPQNRAQQDISVYKCLNKRWV